MLHALFDPDATTLQYALVGMSNMCAHKPSCEAMRTHHPSVLPKLRKLASSGGATAAAKYAARICGAVEAAGATAPALQISESDRGESSSHGPSPLPTGAHTPRSTAESAPASVSGDSISSGS